MGLRLRRSATRVLPWALALAIACLSSASAVPRAEGRQADLHRGRGFVAARILAPHPGMPPAALAFVHVKGVAVAPALRRLRATRGLSTPADARGWKVLSRRDSDTILGLEREARDGLRPVVATAEGLGLRILARFTVSSVGLTVYGEADALASLARHPAVRSVHRAPIARPAIAVSTHDVGAERVLADVGLDGAGTVIAVVDTGIDYTHAALGGPGEAAAYRAATTDVAAISETFRGATLFPNDRVSAGHDFAGFDYAAPEDCQASNPEDCLPRPDPDPIEDPPDRVAGPSASGHGTHVAAIAAGSGLSAGQRGVAPGARVVALKVFGGLAAGSALVPDALEWIARVNLGLAVPGTAPDKIDVVNLSLGELYPGPGLALLDAQVAELLALGVTVVAAAGNDGGRPFSILAPSASAGALSVASVENEPIRGGLWLDEPDGKRASAAVAAAFAPPLGDFAPITGSLALVEDPCGEAEVAADVVALAMQEGCRPEQIARAVFNRGARALLLEPPGSAPALRLQGEASGVSRPVLSVAAAEGRRWRSALEAGAAITATLDASAQAGQRGPSDFAARGPAANGALKPDVSAPGDRISAARSGSGRAHRSISGSSMAAPHAAGAAALLRQRASREGLDLDPRDIAALLKSTARVPGAPPGPDESRSQAQPVRVGAGLLAVDRAATTRIVVRAGDLAEVDLGALALQGSDGGPAHVLTRSLRMRSLDGRAAQVRVEGRLSEDLGGAVSLRAPEGALALPSTGFAIATVTITLRPERLPAPDGPAGAPLRPEDLDEREAFGQVTLRPLRSPDDGAESPASHVLPVYALLRRASDIRVSVGDAHGAGAVEARSLLTLSNRGGLAGEVLVLRRALGGPSGWRFGATWLASTPERAASLELVAARAEAHTADVLAYPAAWIDLDRDGSPEWRVDLAERAIKRGGEAYATWTAGELSLRRVTADGAVVGSPQRIPASVRLFTQLVRMSVPLEAIGLTDPTPVSLWISPAGWFPPSPDAQPGLPPAGSAFVRLPATYGPPGRSIAPGASSVLEIPWAARVPQLVALPDNVGQRAWAQSRLLGAGPIHLPSAHR